MTYNSAESDDWNIPASPKRRTVSYLIKVISFVIDFVSLSDLVDSIAVFRI